MSGGRIVLYCAPPWPRGTRLSLARQNRIVSEYAARRGLDAKISTWQVQSLIRDGPVARIATALGSLGQGDHLVVARLSVIIRDLRDLLSVLRLARRDQWTLHVVEEGIDSSGPEAEALVRVLGSMVCLDSEEHGARTSAALAELRRQGRRTSRHAPYGYRLEGDRLVEVPEEKVVFALAEELRAGGLGCVRIAKELNRRGLRARNGREWYGQLVERVLRPRR